MSTLTASRSTSLWRLELTRQARTHRLLGLGALFLLLGLCMPIMNANMRWLLERSEETRAVAASLPAPTPASGFGAYLDQITQLGLVVLVVSAAGPLCPYGRDAPAAYHRMLARGFGPGWSAQLRALVLPRYGALTGVSILVYLVGIVGAWYETAVLIGAPNPARVLVSTLLFCVYLVWVNALVALVGALATNSVVTAALSVLVIVLSGIVESVPVLGRAMPTGLAGYATTALTATPADSCWITGSIALVSAVAMLLAAGFALDRRQL